MYSYKVAIFVSPVKACWLNLTNALLNCREQLPSSCLHNDYEVCLADRFLPFTPREKKKGNGLLPGSKTHASGILRLHFVVKSLLSQEDVPNLTVLLLHLLSEQHVFVGNERFHHESLVSDVVERRHGVQLGGPHQRRAEDDAQVLAGHEVLLL